MSNTTTLAIGLGSGLALWYLTKTKPSPATPPSPSSAPRNCAAVTIASTGVSIDGTPVDIGEAIRCCQSIGAAEVTVEPHAPAATYAAVMTGLQTANVPTQLAEQRNARRSRSAMTMRSRNRKAGR